MSFITKSFSKYSLRYTTSAGGTGVLIDLYEGFATNVGRLHFFADGKPQPANYTEGPAQSPVVHLHFPMSSYPHIISILRDEKPLAITYNVENKGGEIYTGTPGSEGTEPVGEQEGV